MDDQDTVDIPARNKANLYFFGAVILVFVAVGLAFAGGIGSVPLIGDLKNIVRIGTLVVGVVCLIVAIVLGIMGLEAGIDP